MGRGSLNEEKYASASSSANSRTRGQSASAILYGDTASRGQDKKPLLDFLVPCSECVKGAQTSKAFPGWDSVATASVFADDMAAVWIFYHEPHTLVRRNFTEGSTDTHKAFTIKRPNGPDDRPEVELWFPKGPLEEIRTDKKRTILHDDCEISWSEALQLVGDQLELGEPEWDLLAS